MALITNCVNYYKLDGNPNDSAGSNNGTNTSVTYNNSFGIINQGIQTTGTSSFVSAAALNPSSFNSGLSFSVWSRPTASSNGLSMSISGGSFGDCGISFQQASIGYLFGTGSSNNQHNTGGTWSTNTWYHVVVTHAGATEQIFVNGTLMSTDSGGTLGGNGSNGINIGSGGGGGGGFTGDVDEVGIWTRALTQTDVTQLYNGGIGLQYPFTLTATALPFKSLLGVGI